MALETAAAAALGAAGAWVVDKAAGVVFERAAEGYLVPEKHKPYVERLAEKLMMLEVEHESLVALCERLIEQRDRYHELYLTAQRAARR